MAPARPGLRDVVLPVIVAASVGAVLALVRGIERPIAPPDAGAPSCGSCHPEQVAAWQASTHARAEQGPEQAPTRQVSVEGEGHPVVGTVGVDPLVQVLVAHPEVPGARQALPRAYDPHADEWFDALPDAPAGSWSHWRGRGLTYEASCASCHATGVRKGYDGEGYQLQGTPGVGCEACHGQVDGHARQPGPMDDEAGRVDTCLPCHTRRAELTDGYVVGAPFLDHFAPQLVDGVHQAADGQVLEEVFEGTAFVGSVMHGAGVGCVDCHEPHGGGLRREGDALCRGCHDGLGTVAHDLHDPPRACVDCHMPTTVFMARDPRHDHGFVLPDPVSAERLGLPDPCLGCHEASEALSAAYREHYRGGHRQVAAVVAGALRGDPSVVEELADLIGHEEPRIRQRAAGAAGALATQVAVARALEAAIDDDDGWVRFAAVSSLAEAGPSQALRGALDDELRAVRVAAARGMVGSLDASHAAADDYRAYLRHNADQPAALAEQARWALAVGHLDEALGAFDASLALDPDHLPAFDGRAVVRAGLGDHQGALEDARRAARLAPDDAELRFRLGLALVGAGERGEAEAVLQSLPGHGRALQQLGLLRVARGDHAGGLAALFAAEDQSPEDAEIRYLIAWALADWGRLDDARLAARRVLAVDPDHADARALLRRLP